MAAKFRALIVRESSKGNFIHSVEKRSIDSLPDGDVLIRVRYSSLNYKDALSTSGNRGVTRRYPHTPGIDGAGIVESCTTGVFNPGDQVLVHGYDLGMNTAGGFGQYIRVPEDWVVPLPDGLSLRESMILGTAGFTAAMSIHKIESHSGNRDGSYLVTGATGGVGSFAVAILHLLGYSATAATGKSEQHDYLHQIGADEIIARDEVLDATGKALLQRKWAGVVDTVGGDILATAIRSTDYEGIVTTCGNAASHELALTVYPFILRGVSLLGIDSANYPMPIRREIWKKLASDWKPPHLEQFARESTLDDLSEEVDRILAGQQIGRVLVNLES